MKNVVIGILSAALLYLFFYSKNQARVAENTYLNNTNALTEELKQVENKLGETSYKVTTLQSENVDFLNKLETKDSTILRLKTLVKEYENDIDDGGSITVIRDTIFLSKTVAVTDSNTFNYNDRWINLNGVVTDSLKFNLGVKNDYSVVIGYESNGLWKTKTPYTLVTNKNPYSEVKAVKSFNVVVPQRKWSIGVNGGFGIIYNQGALVPGFGVMFGVNYRLL